MTVFMSKQIIILLNLEFSYPFYKIMKRLENSKMCKFQSKYSFLKIARQILSYLPEASQEITLYLF